MVDADSFGNIIDVAYNFCQRCFGIQAPIGAQKSYVEVDADDAIRFATDKKKFQRFVTDTELVAILDTGDQPGT